MNSNPSDPDDDAQSVLACPACESSEITRRVGGFAQPRPDDGRRFRCKACDERFDDAIRRAPRQPSRLSGLARELADAEPDDLRGDGGTVTACPECGSARLRHRALTGRGRPPESDAPWVCRDCEWEGDEPVEREALTDGGGPAHGEPIAQFDDAVCFYYEAAAANPVRPPEHPDDSIPSPTRHEGPVAIYGGWVRLGGPIPTWVPREAVEAVHER
jgi:transposase-like protein